MVAYHKEVNRMEILSEEEKKELRLMLEAPIWKTVQDRLERLSIKKEREKAESLRAHNFDLANRTQGIVDGISLTLDTIEKMALKEIAKEEGPIY